MIPPFDAWVISRLKAGLEVNGELECVSPRFQKVVARIQALEYQDLRNYVWDGFLDGQDDRDKIIEALAAADPERPPIAEKEATCRVANLSDLTMDDRGRFVWHHHLVRAHLNLLSSNPKVGKTHFCLDLARRLWFHQPWPDGQDMTFPEGTKTIWVCGDRHQDEVKERAAQFGIPPDAVLLNAEPDNPYGGVDMDDPENITGLRRRVAIERPGLIVFDTLWRCTKRQLHRTEEVNSFVSPILAIAQDLDVTIVACMHLSLNEETIGRRMDGVARAILKLTEPDPSQLGRRKLEITGNFKEPDALGMTFKDDGFDYDDDPPPEREKSKGGRPSASIARARAFILEALETEDNIISVDLKQLCVKRKTASEKTYGRALNELKKEGLVETSGGAGTSERYTIHRTDKTPRQNMPNPIPPEF